MVNLWNTQVKSGDIVYHLGDFSFHKSAEKTIELIDQLKGQIVMIKGNHDHSDAFRMYIAHNKVIEVTHYKEIKIAGVNSVMFHFPIAVWHRQHHGAWHLHGHSHGNYTPLNGKVLDVGLDSAYNVLGEHRFFTEEDIAQYMETRPLAILDHHTAREGDM